MFYLLVDLSFQEYMILLSNSPNQRSFRGPGGAGRGLDFGAGPKSVRGDWPLWSPVVFRGLQGPPVDDGTDNRYSSKVSNTTSGS